MALDVNKVSLSRVLNKARELFTHTTLGRTVDIARNPATQTIAREVAKPATDLVGGSLGTIKHGVNYLRTGDPAEYQAQMQSASRAFGSGLENGKFKFTGTGAPALAAQAYGGLSPYAKGFAVTSAGLGAVGAKLSGGDVAQGIGQGINSGLQTAGLVNLTNPYIGKALSKLPIKAPQIVQNRLAPAIGNVVQGIAINKAQAMPTTLGGVAFDAATGLLGGKGQFSELSKVDDLLKQGKALGFEGISPRVSKIYPDDLDVMRQFADEVLRRKGAKKDLGELGVSAQRLAEHYFGGDWKYADNKKLAKAFEWAIDLNMNLPREVRGPVPKANFAGGTPRLSTDPTEALKVEARKYKTTINLKDKNDLEYLERIFSKGTINDILNGKRTNWRGESYEDLARVNFISETPKTIEQQLAGKIKDYKPVSDTFYHGTSADSARKIMGEGFKSGTELPKDAYRGGGYGKIQEGVSFAETPKEAGIFSTLTRDGEIVEAKLKKGAKVVTIDGVEDAVELADYTKYLKKQGIDAVYIGGGEKELVVLNTKAVTPVKSQLTDLYNQAKGAVNQVQPGKVQLKPKTKLLQEAERLRNAGAEQLAANQELAQMNQANRSMFSDSQIKNINRLKQIARSNKALEGDIETLRKLTPDGLTDKVLTYVKEATGIKGQGNEEQLLQTALELPTKASTKVIIPVEIKDARELEKQAKQLRDLVFNSETDLKVKEQAVASNQKLIEKSALSDFKEWEKQLFSQESAKRMTPNRQAERVAGAIKVATTPSFAKPEVISKTQDISNAGKGLTDIYRNVDRVFGKDSQVRKQILEPFDTAKVDLVDDLENMAKNLDNDIVKKYGFTKGSQESADIQKYGEKLITRKQLVEKYGDKKAGQIIAADSWFRSQYDNLLSEVNAVRAKIYPNNPDMQIPRRKDYYRHFQDISGFSGLKNLFDNPAGIEPGLAGVSEVTKPRSKWLSFAQERLGSKTQYDAIGGYLDYAGAQTYAKRIDPFIGKFRTLRQELVDATSTKGDKNYGKLNNFIEFLDDYANDLAGKTNPADRLAQKYMGRKVFSVLNWVNSRTKANVIVGNLSSSIAQFFNIPQGVAEAGVVNSSKGLARTMGSVLDNTNTPMTKSEFIKTRFAGDIADRFDVGVLNNVKKAASWITGIGDEIGTKFIWNSIYEKALSQGIDNPIKYADDMTRKMVAGRGIGEVPLLQKSKTFQLIAPFQLEVANVWHVMRDWAGEKAANKFVTFFVASYLMNRAAEKIRGSDVSLDPIQAGIEGIQAYNEEDDKRIGVLRAAGRLFGEALSNIPGGQTVAAMYPEFGTIIGGTKLPTRSSLFGEGDPTRFGSGLLASKGLSDPLFKIIPPYGGAQIKKTLQGLGSVAKGYSESASGKVRFPVKKNLANILQAGAFGQYATPEARQYFNQKQSVLGDKQSQAYKTILDTQGVGAAQNFYNSILKKRGKSDVSSGSGETSSDLTVIQAKMDNSPELLTPEEIATYYKSRVSKPTTESNYENAVYEKDVWSQVSNINSRESFTQQQKDQAAISLLESIGVSPQDYQYYTVAKENNDIKSLYAEEEITKMIASGKPKEEIYQWMVDSRREVNGKQLLASGVIDYLVDQNILSYSEGKQLKAIKVTGSGSTKIASSKKSTAKPKKITVSKKISAPKVKIITNPSAKFKAPVVKRINIKKAKKLNLR